MQVNPRGRDPGVAHQVGDHIDPGAGVDGVAAEGMSELVGAHRVVESGPPRRRGHQLADGVRAHRCADPAAEQVDEHEVAVGGAGDRMRSNS